MIQFTYPYKISGNGRTSTSGNSDHIRQLIEQVLFTSIGERVNRPAFGSPISQLVFASNSKEVAASTQFMIQGALQQWLGNMIHVESVTVTSEESTLRILVQYIIKQNQQRLTAEFVKEA